MQGKGGSLKTLGVAMAITLVVLAALVGALFYTENTELTAKDAEILSLRAVMLSQNLTILELKLNALSLDANITILSEKIAALEINQTANAASILSLNVQLLRLENESSMASLELAVAEQAYSFSVVPYYDNKTVSVAPGSSVELASQSAPSNGTIAFLSVAGCPSSGDTIRSGSTGYDLTIGLAAGGTPLKLDFRQVDDQPFAVSLRNTGSAPVRCTFSLLYLEK